MEAVFQKYLRNFLKRYQIDPAGIDFNCISDYQSMVNQLEGHTPNLSTIRRPLKIIFALHNVGIYIYKDEYKTSERYLQKKSKWLHINKNEITSTENYIERFLLDRHTLLDVYDKESKYAMGNPYEFYDDDKECKLAEILMQDNANYTPNDDETAEDIEFNSDESISTGIEELNLSLIKMLLRPCDLDSTSNNLITWGGLVSRLRHNLHFDIKKFPFTMESKAEICKVIYFFLKLEHTSVVPKLQGKKNRCDKRSRHEPFFSATDFLGYPSMENIGYAYLRRKTYNGKITLRMNLKRSCISRRSPL